MDDRLAEHRLAEILIQGYSVAGEESVIAAPELNVCFDIGKAPSEAIPIDHVLLSHGHMDHAAGLAYYFSQRNFVGNSPGCALVPKTLVNPIKDLMRAWGAIEGHISPHKLVGLDPGDEFTIRRGLVAKAFELNHQVPSIGFVVIDVRHKLRPEFAEKTGPELVALKKQGVEIEYQLQVPLIAYCGDTAEGKWAELPMVRSAKVLLLECTFFEPDQIQRARAGYHMHARDLARLVPKLANEHIVITHVTRRTGIRQARQTLARLIDRERLERIVFLMEGRKPRRHNRADATGGPALKPKKAADRPGSIEKG